jgi:hypothetical protein
MAIDFWNNPLVISAFRVKYRRSGPFTSLSLYVTLLACGCVAAWYLIPGFMGRPFAEHEKLHFIFSGLLVLQTGLSLSLAMGMTGSALSAEVNNGTLDYQRLTPMTPAEVLTGLLFGPPASAYLMIMASMPLTFALWSFDATGISFATLLLLYLQLFTSAFMGAAIGLVKPLRSAADQKSAQQQMSGWGCLSLIIFMSFAGNITRLPALLSGKETAVVGLIVPLGPLTGLFEQDNPWHYGLNFFGITVSFLLLTPLVQLGVAGLCFVFMVRRLTNTANPALTKPLAYLVLAIIDVLAAAVLFEPGPADPELGPRSMTYWLCHGLATLFLVSAVTPDRELLLSWIWRFRNRYSRLRDLGWQDRSPNLLLLVTTSTIGVAVYFLLVAVPALLVAGWNEARPTDPRVIYPLLLACVLTLSLGMLSQVGKLLAGRGGGWIVLLPVLVDLTAFWAGDYLHTPWLSQFSAVAHWRNLQSVGEQPLSVLPVVCLHAMLFIWSWRVLQRNLRLESKKVQRKLRDMGVTPPVGHPS